MANADTPEDALAARNNGAEGIGLCRTEHMVLFSFFTTYCLVVIHLATYYNSTVSREVPHLLIMKFIFIRCELMHISLSVLCIR